MFEIGDTISFRSIFSEVEKQNLEMKRLLAKTEARINRTKGHIDYLKRLKVWTVNNLHEMGQEVG